MLGEVWKDFAIEKEMFFKVGVDFLKVRVWKLMELGNGCLLSGCMPSGFPGVPRKFIGISLLMLNILTIGFWA